MKKIAIFGKGGFGRELFFHFTSAGYSSSDIIFVLSDEFYNSEKDTIPLSEFDSNKYKAFIAVGDPATRSKLVRLFPKNTEWGTFIHPSAQILGNDIRLGEGSIICAGAVLTTNIKLGKHTHINLNATIGHDCLIGDFFTAAPGVNISGKCIIGNCVYMGTNSSIRDKLTVCDHVTIGLNAGVVKSILKSGTFVGVPAKKI